MSTPIFGIVGWKNSGKTTLTARLIAELSSAGYKVAAAKHTHHTFDVDHQGRNSYKFREAGAREVAIVSAERTAILHELRGEAEPSLGEIVARLSGSDLVLAEGFKYEPHPKIEARRRDARHTAPLTGADIVAIAADHPVDAGPLPSFDIDDIAGIAGFILRHTGLAR